MDCAPSSYYYQCRCREETALRDEVERIALCFPRYGYRRMRAELGRRGYEANHKRVLKVMREANLLVQVQHYVRTTFSWHGLGEHPNLVKELKVTAPNEVWCSAITYIRLLKEFCYLAVLMEVFTRGIRGWHLSVNLTEELVVRALERGLGKHPAPCIHHID